MTDIIKPSSLLDIPGIPDTPGFPDLGLPPDIPIETSPCPSLDALGDLVKSKASAAVDAIMDSIPSDPTSGTAGTIGAKIADAVQTVKQEAEELLDKAKGLAGTINETFMDYVTKAQNKIAELEAALIDATEEATELILQEIEEIKDAINERIPAWMHKTPEELLQDVVDKVCDPDVFGLGLPEEGTAKKVIPTETPVDNPSETAVEVFAAPSKPKVETNPIKL